MQITSESVAVVRPGQMPKGVKSPLWWGVGERLRSLGVENGLTQQQIAAAASVSRTTISQIELSHRAPGIDVVESVAVALDVPAVWLAYGEQGHWPFRQRYPRPVIPVDPPEVALAVREVPGKFKGFGARLRNARFRRRLSLRQLAQTVADKQKENFIEEERRETLTGQGIQLLEAGTHVPSVRTCWLLALGLDVSPGWLAYGEGEGLGDKDGL